MFLKRIFATAAWVVLLCSSNAWGVECNAMSNLINSSFEAPLVSQPSPPWLAKFGASPAVKIYDQSNVPGWNNPNGEVEIWESGFQGVASYDGNQHAEIQSSSFTPLYQEVTTVPGSVLRWRFAHRGRQGTDTGELRIGPVGATVAQGQYTTSQYAWQLYTGTYVVPAGQTTTRFEFYPVVSGYGSTTIGNFLDAIFVEVDCDYGDAPAGYPVTIAQSGAGHLEVTGVHLGSALDIENDGQPSANGAGDDADGTDDEDGVDFGLTAPARGQSHVVDVVASVDGFVNAWIDFNGDQAWSASEQIFSDVPVNAGSNTLSFSVPVAAALGTTYARFRFTSDDPAGALGPTEGWFNGEVEDHPVTIVPVAELHWRFDEYLWSGSGGEAQESGGSGHDGTPTNGPVTAQPLPALPGATGTCNYGVFDGADDVVAIGDIPELNLDYPPHQLTLMAWIRPANFNSRAHYVVARGQSGSGGNRFEIALQTRGARYELRQRTGSSVWSAAMSAPSGDVGQWVHLAATYDGTRWRLYRNGVEGASVATVGPQAATGPLWAIGGRHPANGGRRNFEGAIDEVRILTQALNASEVAAYMNAAHPCPQPAMQVAKSLLVIDDGGAGANPKAIPGAEAVYTITVTNTGTGANDSGTLVLSDPLPEDVEFFSGDFDGGGSPIEFVEGSPASGLSLNFVSLADATDGVEFLDAGASMVVPNGGYDPAVRSLRILLDGVLPPAGSTFSLRFRVRLK